MWTTTSESAHVIPGRVRVTMHSWAHLLQLHGCVSSVQHNAAGILSNSGPNTIHHDLIFSLA
jgi:hypothetical protein